MRLIQDEYRGEPWKIMVCCILLNQTSNKQVRPLLDVLFGRFPGPSSVKECDHLEISEIIRTTGFQNVKASRIIRMSQKFTLGFKDPIELPGIGKYGVESWKIFVDDFIEFNPSDRRLKEYIAYLKDGNKDRNNPD